MYLDLSLKSTSLVQDVAKPWKNQLIDNARDNFCDAPVTTASAIPLHRRIGMGLKHF
jgi:hypothetical protein